MILKEWGTSESILITVTPDTGGNDFLAELNINYTRVGISGTKYTSTDIVTNLNAAFLNDHFIDIDGVIRIQGPSYGRGNFINVHCGSATNYEYAIVAKDIFGLDFIQVNDLEVEGIGEPMTSFSYIIEPNWDTECVTLEDDDQQNMQIDIETDYYEVVVENQDNYYIEMLQFLN